MGNFKEMGSFSMVIGGSGSGKTTSYVVPEVLKAINADNSFVITDAKKEILSYVGKALKTGGYNTVILDLRDFTKSASWNPLFLPYKAYCNNDLDKCYYLLDCIAQSMFNQGKDTDSDPYWIYSSRDLFIGLAFALFEDATSKEEVNLCSIYSMAMSAHDRCGASNYLNEYINLKPDKRSYAVSCSYGTVKAPTETRSSILSVFHQKLRSLTMNDRYNAVLGDGSIDLEELLGQKVAFIIQYEDEIEESSVLANIFISQLLYILVDWRAKGDSKYNEFDVFFEDFLLLNYFPNITHLVMTCKSRKINLAFSLNDLSYAEKIYGEKIVNFLLDNCDRIAITNSKSRAIVAYLKTVYGETKIVNNTKPNSTIVINNHSDFEVIEKKYAFPKGEGDGYFGRRLTNKQEISVFSVKDFVDNIKERRFKEIINQKKFETESFDDILKQIGTKIEEIEAEERADSKSE